MRPCSLLEWLHPGLMVMALLAPLTGARAADFFVAPTGDDAADGSSAQPWLTLQRAADAVAPGDHVEVRPGTYAGFSVHQAGTADARITFHAAPGTLITTAAVGTPNCIHLEDAGFVTIEGFELRACINGLHTIDSPGAIVRNNRITGVTSVGISIHGGADVLIEGNRIARTRNGLSTWNADRVTIRRNEVSQTDEDAVLLFGDLQPTVGALVEQNTIHDVDLVGGGSALGLDGVQDSVLRNNLLYGCHSAGIVLYQIDGLRPSTGNLVVNNTVLVAADGRWSLSLHDGALRTVALNNILLDANPLHGALSVDAASLPTYRGDFNVVTDALSPDNDTTTLSLAGWRAATGQDASSLVTTDPLFVDEARFDFHLRRGSPAIDRGTAASAPGADLDGFARPVGAAVDVGAYEFCEGDDCVVPVVVSPVDGGAAGPGPARYQVGCGCRAGTAGEAEWLLLALAVAAGLGRRALAGRAA